MILTMQEYDLLLQIRHRPLPVARFELHSSAEPELVSTALNHVYMTSPEASMEQVKETASLLSHLEELGLIEVIYRPFATAPAAYEIYRQSGLFAELKRLTEEGRERPGFLFDTPIICRGLAVPTGPWRHG